MSRCYGQIRATVSSTASRADSAVRDRRTCGGDAPQATIRLSLVPPDRRSRSGPRRTCWTVDVRGAFVGVRRTAGSGHGPRPGRRATSSDFAGIASQPPTDAPRTSFLQYLAAISWRAAEAQWRKSSDVTSVWATSRRRTCDRHVPSRARRPRRRRSGRRHTSSRFAASDLHWLRIRTPRRRRGPPRFVCNPWARPGSGAGTRTPQPAVAQTRTTVSVRSITGGSIAREITRRGGAAGCLDRGGLRIDASRLEDGGDSMRRSLTVVMLVFASLVLSMGSSPAVAADSPIGTWVKKGEAGKPGSITLTIEEWELARPSSPGACPHRRW